MRQALLRPHDDVFRQLKATRDTQAIAAPRDALEQPIRRRQLDRVKLERRIHDAVHFCGQQLELSEVRGRDGRGRTTRQRFEN